MGLAQIQRDIPLSQNLGSTGFCLTPSPGHCHCSRSIATALGHVHMCILPCFLCHPSLCHPSLLSQPRSVGVHHGARHHHYFAPQHPGAPEALPCADRCPAGCCQCCAPQRQHSVWVRSPVVGRRGGVPSRMLSCDFCRHPSGWDLETLQHLGPLALALNQTTLSLVDKVSQP